MSTTTDVTNALPAELNQAAINPEQYAAAVIAPFQAALTKAISEDVTEYDVTTTAGMKVATARRAVFRDIRVAAEKERVSRKAPLLEIGRLLDAKAKDLHALVKPYEDRHDALIKAEEERKAAEKAEKERIERARIAEIHEHIADINAIPGKCVGKSAAQIASVLADTRAQEIDIGFYADFTGTALQARQNVVAKLEEMLAAQQAHEAEQERLRLEREELARQQAEQRRIEAEAAAVRRAQEEADRARRETEEAAHRQRLADEERARREQLEAEQAELQRQQATARAEAEELARKQAAFRQEQEAAEAKAKASLAAEQGNAQAVAAAKTDAPTAEAGIAQSAETGAARASAAAEPKRPSDDQIIVTLALHYRVHELTVVSWLQSLDLKAAEETLAAEFA